MWIFENDPTMHVMNEMRETDVNVNLTDCVFALKVHSLPQG